jgi:hypothetical protein
MKTLTIFILLCITICSYGQPAATKKDRFLTYEQNQNWLKSTKSFDTYGQWTAIKQRFFHKENCNTYFGSIQYSPLIVINGVPLHIPEELTDEERRKTLSLLNEESIDQIVILDKLSEEWIFCKPFSGVIIMKVDEKIEKKLFNQKLE